MLWAEGFVNMVDGLRTLLGFTFAGRIADYPQSNLSAQEPA